VVVVVVVVALVVAAAAATGRRVGLGAGALVVVGLAPFENLQTRSKP
jgi:hypothetical protein